MITPNHPTYDLLENSVQDIQIILDRASILCPEIASERYDRLRDHIGNTAIEAVTELPTGVFIKRELDNLSGSHYDRAYLPTIEYLEHEGLIRPGDELRDITSGSAGTSLAVLGHALGYPVRITVPNELPRNRLHVMRAFGANIQQAGNGYVRRASQQQRAEIINFAKDKAWKRMQPADKAVRALIFEHTDGERICYLNHSENAQSPQSFSAIAREAVAQLVNPPDVVALAIGNWTTIAGISPVFRAVWPKAHLIGYEGQHSDSYENFGTTSHDATGTDVPVSFRDPSLVDEVVQISNNSRDAMHETVNGKRTPAERLGRSSLMGLVIAEQAVTKAKTVLTIGYDHLIRY